MADRGTLGNLLQIYMRDASPTAPQPNFVSVPNVLRRIERDRQATARERRRAERAARPKRPKGDVLLERVRMATRTFGPDAAVELPGLNAFLAGGIPNTKLLRRIRRRLPYGPDATGPVRLDALRVIDRILRTHGVDAMALLKDEDRERHRQWGRPRRFPRKPR